MGRRSHSQTLTLWANGDYVGRWTITARGDMELQYDGGWLASAHGRPISLSLPFNLNNEPLKGERVAHYFEGLLPDSDAIRKRVAARFKTGSTEAFNLLAAIGRDCVGALQLLPEGETPSGVDRIDGVVVDDEAIERHLLELVTPDRFAGARDPDDDFRFSLAGAQEKDAFLWWGDKWMKPRGATPTTHIFKLPLGLVGGRQADFSTSVDNEWLCLRLFKAYGLSTAKAHIATFGKRRVLVVERFDRVVSSDGTRLFRLIQEDFCQATGTSPLVKYENEGGPGLKQLFPLVQQSLDAERDLRALMASQILFWMLRAPDGHAKNFSIQLQAGTAGRFRLTPMYDVMSAYPVIGEGPNQWAEQDLKLAMALLSKNRHYRMHAIQRRHFNSTAQKLGYGGNAEPLLQELVARTPEVVAQVQAELPQGFSQQVADKVLGGLLDAARALEGMPPV
ncbi:type II toxin-antitoxin system HipA family toxin [Mycetohabitans sp. B5]|uniref:Serine/threonine-protein kinase HipA n=1 Tax=Mycetohabitans endofungorum TaxID=417203 RepID=A0A2P5KD25_9BURK|nr:MULTISPECIES: type II toxin-antitoxin system HipA family toxin [Mycetohabitans]MCG1053469.1 type II toxin-antitoxin system HipA family toxin [Mycetohabitans sp. B5]PPB84610.1 serine/threonine-protein kinase HipA [Mycetohabitans endofungorum]